MLYLLGTLLVQTRRYDEAAALLERALAAGVANVTGTRNNLGIALRELGRPEEAIASYDAVLALKPDDVEALNNRGVALYDLGRAEEAKACYRRVLELQPDYVQSLNNLGLILRDEKHLDEAAECLERAVAIKPDYVEGLNNLGLIWQARKDFEKALPWHLKAVEMRPDDPEALNNLGANYMSLLRAEEAVACFERALAMRPTYVDAQNNISNVLLVQNRPAEAIPYYERALAMREDYPSAHWNRGIARLLSGDFTRGWEGYEWRFEEDKVQKRMFATPIRTDVPMWQGEDLAGKTLWVRCEQGSGDILQYARFLPMLQARGARVIFECAPNLHQILDGGADEIIGEVPPDAPPPDGCDFQVYVMSLTHRLGITLDNLPNCAVPPGGRGAARGVGASPGAHPARGEPAAGQPQGRHRLGGQPDARQRHEPLGDAGGLRGAGVRAGRDAVQPAKGQGRRAGGGPAREHAAGEPGAGPARLRGHRRRHGAPGPGDRRGHVRGPPGGRAGAARLDAAAAPPGLALDAGPGRLALVPDHAPVPAARAEGLAVGVRRGPARRWNGSRRPPPRDEAVAEAERLFAARRAGRRPGRQLVALTQQPRPPVRALNDLGVICWQGGEREEALGLFLRALQVDPTDRTTLLNCADALRAFGQEEDAQALLRAAAAGTAPTAEGRMSNGLPQVGAPTADCKCCGAESPLFGVVDFHKNCRFRVPGVLPLSGSRRSTTTGAPPAGFCSRRRLTTGRRKSSAGTSTTTSTSRWTPTFWGRGLTATPRRSGRCSAARRRPGCWTTAAGRACWRSACGRRAFPTSQTYDPFVPEHARRPQGCFDCIVSFEVMEHSPRPRETLAEMDSLLAEDGLILFSTLVQGADFEKEGMDWWYVGPRNGHVSLFSRPSLRHIAEPMGFQFGSFSDGLHVLFRQVPDFARHLDSSSVTH